MEIIKNKIYQSDISHVALMNFPWACLENSLIIVTGANGLIGSCLIDIIMYRNINLGMKCMVYAIGRNEERAKKRFCYCWDNELFAFINHDVNNILNISVKSIDYIFHFASNTHPVSYATEPIETITTNIVGTSNILNLASEFVVKRVMFASSNEIYGENRGDVEKYDEKYCGYIDSNTLRAGYPESKRCAEALCQAFIKQKGLDIVILRLTRSYGPTMLNTDTKAISQFIHNCISDEDIILKSEGTQYYSYTYVIDAVSGLLTAFFYGNNGEAYNIADANSDIMLKDLAGLIANQFQKKVVYKLPSEIEKIGFSTATKARLDSKKLQKLGWKADFDIYKGIKRTIDILKDLD